MKPVDDGIASTAPVGPSVPQDCAGHIRRRLTLFDAQRYADSQGLRWPAGSGLNFCRDTTPEKIR